MPTSAPSQPPFPPIVHAHHNAQCTVEYPACTSSKKATVRARPAKLPAIVDAHAGREWKAWCAAVNQSSLIFVESPHGESHRAAAFTPTFSASLTASWWCLANVPESQARQHGWSRVWICYPAQRTSANCGGGGIVAVFPTHTHAAFVVQARLPPEVNRALYVRNLPYKITAEEMYDIFGKYGAIRQIRKCVQTEHAGVASSCALTAVCVCACVRVCVSPWCWWCCWRNRGATAATKGTAFVVYEDIYDAKNAVEHLSGFNVCGRYLIVLYYQPKRAAEKREIEKEKAELEALKKKYGVGTDAEDAQAR